MLQRRDFLRGLFGLGLSMGIPATDSKAQNASPVNSRRCVDQVKYSTIYTHLANEPLEQHLRQFAIQQKLKITPGDLHNMGTDMLVFPYFVSVIDRSLIGGEIWDFFVDWRNEGDATEPCIIVDDLTHLPMPWRNIPIRISLSKDNAAGLICKKITEIELTNRFLLLDI